MVLRQLTQQLDNLKRHVWSNANAYESSIEDEDFTCDRYRSQRLTTRRQQPARKPQIIDNRKNDIGVDVKTKNFQGISNDKVRRPEKPHISKPEPKHVVQEETKHAPIARVVKPIIPMMKYKLDNAANPMIKSTSQVNSAFTPSSVKNAEQPQDEYEDDDSLFEDAEEEPEQKPRKEVNIPKIKSRVNMMINRAANVPKSQPVKLKEEEVVTKPNIPVQK